MGIGIHIGEKGENNWLPLLPGSYHKIRESYVRQDLS